MSKLNYKHHIFCCTNMREGGKKSCGLNGAVELRKYAKQCAKELGIKDIRVSAAGCLGQCKKGPVMVIYPEGVWYTYKDEKDIERILEEHLIKHKTIKKLELSA